jgi:hypothetical protein
MMERRTFLATLGAAFAITVARDGAAQSKSYDVDLESVPKPVLEALAKYVAILRTSKNLDECAERFVEVAGGSLVNEDGKSLRGSVKPYSLKKDFDNVRFYADPTKITRIAKLPSKTSGFGPSAITGETYKIWVGKKDGVAGMPAPISILVPTGHKTIKSPKVVSIGSL